MSPRNQQEHAPTHRISQIGLHRIQNMGFGHVGDKGRLRVVFPETFDIESRPRPYPTAEFKQFFADQILLPTLRELHGPMGPHYPLDREHRMWAARTASGKSTNAMKYVANDVLDRFLPALHHKVRTLAPLFPMAKMMKGFVIAWEIQDIKLKTTTLNGETNEERYAAFGQEAIEKALYGIEINRLKMRNVHFDIAVEMSLPCQTLYFSTDGHAKILETVLGYDEGQAKRMAACYGASAPYQRDRMCSLAAISGFHLNLKGAKSPNNIFYAQAYHTEKEIAYQSSSDNKIVHLSPIEFLRDPDQGRSNSLYNWVKSCNAALDAQIKTGTVGAARFEAAVSGLHIDQVSIDFSDELLSETLVALPREAIP